MEHSDHWIMTAQLSYCYGRVILTLFSPVTRAYFTCFTAFCAFICISIANVLNFVVFLCELTECTTIPLLEVTECISSSFLFHVINTLIEGIYPPTREYEKTLYLQFTSMHTY